MLASGSAHRIETEAPPDGLLRKHCEEGEPWARTHHKWSWTKSQQGARVEFQTGEWNHKWLAHELCRHGLVMSVDPRGNNFKLKNSTNYYCWLTDLAPASGGSGPESEGWGALMGYSRNGDKEGNAHGWVQFGKNCTSVRQKKLTVAVFLERFGFKSNSIEDAAVLPP